MVRALIASFQPGVPPVTLVLFLIGVRMTRYSTLSAACSSGKWPRRRQAWRNRAFRLSMAFRGVNDLPDLRREGQERGELLSGAFQSWMIAGYWLPQACSNSANAAPRPQRWGGVDLAQVL